MIDTSTKKFDRVVSFGCSLAFGDELVDRKARYANQIAKQYQAKLFDYSVAGTSNENISQSVVNSLLAIKKSEDPSRTLVVVEWTYCTRLNFCGKNNRYYVLTDYKLNGTWRKKRWELNKLLHFNDDFDDLIDVKFYYDQHTNMTNLMYNMSRCIHHVQSFLRDKGYSYIFLFANIHEKRMIDDPKSFYTLGLKEFEKEPEFGHPDSFPYFLYTINDIDKDYICPETFMDYAEANRFKFGPGNHPLEEAHIEYSKVLLDFIESKYGEQ